MYVESFRDQCAEVFKIDNNKTLIKNVLFKLPRLAVWGSTIISKTNKNEFNACADPRRFSRRWISIYNFVLHGSKAYFRTFWCEFFFTFLEVGEGGGVAVNNHLIIIKNKIETVLVLLNPASFLFSSPLVVRLWLESKTHQWTSTEVDRSSPSLIKIHDLMYMMHIYVFFQILFVWIKPILIMESKYFFQFQHTFALYKRLSILKSSFITLFSISKKNIISPPWTIIAIGLSSLLLFIVAAWFGICYIRRKSKLRIY